MSAEKTLPPVLHVIPVEVTEVRFLIPEINKYLDAINKARATPKGKSRAKSPLRTHSEWKKFFETSKFISETDFLPQSTIEAMQNGVGVKEEKKALTFLVGLNNALKKHQLTEKPICIPVQVQIPKKKSKES